ncbi:MAG: DUF2877 domain-containing protein [Halanaerobiales bacterium]|nr:DUF2877 domain-containing protein [Halanaerobiales bacterium]
MKEFIAKSIGDLLYAKLIRKEYIGRIYSVLPTEIKIESENMLYTICKPKVGNGPFVILVPSTVEDMTQWGVVVNAQIIADKNRIILNDSIRISLNNTQIWSNKWIEISNPKNMFKLLPQIKNLVLKEGNLKGLGFFLKGEEFLKMKNDQIINYYQRIILEQTFTLLKKIKIGLNYSSELFWAGVLEMVGLGSGLNPSGDDFLIGFLLTFRYFESVSLIKLPEIDIKIFSEEVKKSTNFASAMFVIQAAKGSPFELASDLIQNLFCNKRISTILSTLRLITRENITRTDFLVGVITAGEIFQEMASF